MATEDLDNTVSIGSIALLMGRVEGKLDALIENLVRSEKKHDLLDSRVDALEKHQSYIYGVIGVFTFVMPIIGWAVSKWKVIIS